MNQTIRRCMRQAMAVGFGLWATGALAQFAGPPPSFNRPPTRGVTAPVFAPPAFIGGVPGAVPMQTFARRHDARTVLYREALEILRQNPHAADVPECAFVETRETLCLNTTPTKGASLEGGKGEPEKAGPRKGGAAAGKSTAKVEPKGPNKSEGTGEAAVAKADGSAPASASLPSVTPPNRPVTVEAPRRLAVLIGNNAYTGKIPPLETPQADVEQVAAVLRTRFGFETRLVKDATKAQLVQALNDIASNSREQDRVLLMYAGHGYLMDDIHMGFWIPVDGTTKSPANWVSNADISKMLKAIPAHQLILVSDSCFSGSLTKEQAFKTAVEGDVERILKQRAVIAFSSGDEEPVSDEGKEGHSAFAYNLIKALEGVKATTPGFKVYASVREKVSAEYEQTPQYGAVVSAGHSAGGEYIFEPRN